MAEADFERVKLIREVFPELAATVDAAYHSFAKHPQQASLDEWLDEQVGEALPGAASLAIADASLAARLDAAFVLARTAAGLLHTSLPEIEAFIEEGVDLDTLAEAMKADPSLTPVPAPYGLGVERWVETFDSLGTRNASDAATSLQLVVATDAAREFAALDTVPRSSLPAVRAEPRNRRTIYWTLRLVPADPGPSLLGLSYAHGPHVSLPEMLMLQLMRVSAGEPPLDATSFTWLAGNLAQGRLAARHVYDTTEAAIRITCREVESQGPHLGARPPIG